MFEYEKKFTLAAEEFATLRQIMIGCAHVHKQTNYYYDTDNLDLNRKGITYRIREKDGIYTATIKQHNHGNYDCSIETSRQVKDEFDDSLFLGKGVKLQGTLITERICILREYGIEVVIDRNLYLGFTDYELEIEYASDNEERADKTVTYIAELLSAEYGKKFSCSEFYNRTKSAKSKSQRFFERLNKTKS